MKCMSCEMEINPKWKHAIDINICPFCGLGIMEEHLKNLFTSLRATMDSLKEYPQQLDDWMLSNHNYIKTDSPDLMSYVPTDILKSLKKDKEDEDFLERKNKKFIVKVTNEDGKEEEVVAQTIQSEEKTNKFFERAEAVKPNIDGFKSTAEKTQRLKAMAQQIKREGATVINQAGMAGVISPEMMESADPEAVAEFQSLMSGGEIASSLPDSGGDDDEIPSVVLAMANKVKGGTKDNSADLVKLQQLQDRVSESRKNFKGSKGSFSRS